jgi:two-component sensor histidine kinase
MSVLRDWFGASTLAVLCGDWRIVAVHVVSNTIIGLAYVSIPIVIVAYLRRRPEIEHRWVFWCFVAFILLCGLTHFAHVWTVWRPAFEIQAAIEIATALVSLATAIALWPLLPRFAKIPTPSEYQAVVVQLQEHRKNLFRDKDMLLRELNHRVRNNLTIVEGSLRLQAKDANEECRAALNSALGRIRAIARVHERIYDDDAQPAQVDTRTFVTGICQDLSAQFDAPIGAHIDSIAVSVDESIPLAMIVNELVTNAIKHGRHPNGRAQVYVTLKRLGGGEDWELQVRDRGPGIDPASVSGRSLGMRMIKSLAVQLGGQLEVASTAQGSTFRVLRRRYAADIAA